ncbi:MAG TPA: ATP-dependent helicase [Acidimicrobiales bacterium]
MGLDLDRALESLTQSQRLAVYEPAQAVCVLAGAGSGKTRVLTLRVARRIRDGEAEADHTVVCTFTRKAAADLRARLRAFGVPTVTPGLASRTTRPYPGSRPTQAGGAASIDDGVDLDAGVRLDAGMGLDAPVSPDARVGPDTRRSTGPGVRAGTLHQLALTLLRRRAADARERPPQLAQNRFRLLTTLVGDQAMASMVDTEITWAKSRSLSPDQYAMHALEAGRSPGGFAGDPSGPAAGTTGPAGRLAGRLHGSSVEHAGEPGGWSGTRGPSGADGPGASVDAVEAVEVMAGHYRTYEETLRRRGVIDLDDVLLRAHDLIEQDPGFADAVRWRYRHLSVDEFQDVNPAQYRLVRTILGDRTDLFVVGDPNQAIYGWNGADPTLILRLPRLIPSIVVHHLDDNHRSSPQVVGAAVAALGSGVSGTPRSTRPDGPVPVIRAFSDETAEAQGVVDTLQAWSASGRSWSDQAVLARTNDQLALVAAALRRARIPYRLAPGPEARERESGKTDGQGVEQASSRGVGQAVERAVGQRTGAGRGQPIGQAGGQRTGAGGGSNDQDSAVELATFHRAKGLEWTSVCVIGLEDGLVPISHAGTTEAWNEERRLLYVALTRASSELCCTWAQSRRSSSSGRRSDREPSIWVGAITRACASMASQPARMDASKRIAELRAGLGT